MRNEGTVRSLSIKLFRYFALNVTTHWNCFEPKRFQLLIKAPIAVIDDESAITQAQQIHVPEGAVRRLWHHYCS